METKTTRIITVALVAAAFTLAQRYYVGAEYIPPGPLYRCPDSRLLLHPCTCDSESDFGITVSCNNTNLASMSVGLNNLATFKLPIQKLTIYRCHMSRLYGSLLYKLNVKVLEIFDTPIEMIDEHTFLGVNNSLNELHIVNSSLMEFPKLAFKILGNLTILKLDHHQISSLPTDSFAGSDLVGKLLRFHLSNGKLSTLPVESLQPLRKLKTLDLHGNQLKDLKRNQFKGLRDTEVLDLSFNNITKIDSSHLADLTKMSWCNVSHNQIAELPRGAFARNAVLKVLNMAHNKIKRLDSNSFRGMRFLRRLYLSDNLITDVGRGTFGSVTRIGTIDLARNFLKKIDYQMFFQLNFVEIIDVSENNVTEIQKLAFKDLYLTNINLSRNAIKKVEATAFENCANITVLDLSHNELSSFPKRAFDETTYATLFQLSYNKFTDLSHVPLQNMTGLKILNVSNNQISIIPKNTFPKLYELHTIDLSHNNLSEIFNSVFQTLFSLRTLDLSHNSMETIKPSTFGPLPTLLDLNLSYNRLRDIARSAFVRLASTRKLTLKGNRLQKMFQLPISTGELDLSDNAFEEMPQNVWPSMNALLSLDLSGNNLGNRLEKGSFLNLLTLQRINLNRNGITEVPWAAFSDLSSLQYIYLEGNNITKLPRATFGKLPVVFEVNLAYNNINNVSSRAFEGLLQLLHLNMTHNNISYIPTDAFLGLVSLISMDLSQNKLEKLDNKTNSIFADCLSLEKLDLSNNKISFLTRKSFPSNPYIPYKLREIDLSFNSMPVLTFDLAFGTARLEKLNLSHNAIADIRRGVIGNLTRLRSIDLSSNKLEDLTTDPEMFRLPINVSEVYLSNNRLQDLPWQHLNNVSRLNVLDIRNNSFDSFGTELTEMVKAKAQVYFAGNPLICNCFLRPLKRYFATLLNVEPFYSAIKCQHPPYVADMELLQLPEERLYCAANVNYTRMIEARPGDYDKTPDMRFRDIQIKSGRIIMKWFVTNNEDIADPYIIIRDTKTGQRIIYQNTLPYFKRSLEIDLNDDLTKELKSGNDEYQICVLATDSKASVRGWNKQQCKDIPTSLALRSKATGTFSRNANNNHFYKLAMAVLLCVIVNYY